MISNICHCGSPFSHPRFYCILTFHIQINECRVYLVILSFVCIHVFMRVSLVAQVDNPELVIPLCDKEFEDMLLDLVPSQLDLELKAILEVPHVTTGFQGDSTVSGDSSQPIRDSSL